MAVSIHELTAIWWCARSTQSFHAVCPVNVVDSEDPNIVASFLECVLPLQPFPCHNRTLGVSRVVDKLPEPKHFLVGGSVGILLHKMGKLEFLGKFWEVFR